MKKNLQKQLTETRLHLQRRSRSSENCFPLRIIEDSSKDMGIGQLKWFHLTGQSILLEERIKTNLRSVEGRNHGRHDEMINSLEFG
jgi:hypothetical protein